LGTLSLTPPLLGESSTIKGGEISGYPAVSAAERFIKL
jgi:hypothetical protein